MNDIFASYECFPDKKEQAQSFFANMSAEQIAAEVPPNVKLLARYHDVPNGTGITILETDDQEAMTAWTLGWATMCHFPIVKPMLDDDAARALIKQLKRELDHRRPTNKLIKIECSERPTR